MAILFDAATDYLTYGTAGLPTTGSVSMWLKPTWAWDDNADHVFFAAAIDASSFFQVRKFSDNNFYCGWVTSPTNYRVVTAASDLVIGWNHIAMTWDDTANEVKLFVAGSQVGSTFATLVTHTTTTAWTIGNDSQGRATGTHTADMAEIAVWDAVLPLSTIASLAVGYSPQFFPTNGVLYTPLIRNIQDIWGGEAGTDNGTAVSEHPASLYPARPQIGLEPFVAPAGGTFIPIRRKRIIYEILHDRS